MKKLVKFFVVMSLLLSSMAFAEGGMGSSTAAGFKQDMMAFKQEMSMKLEGAESEIMALKEKAKVKGSHVKQATIADLEKTKMKIKSDLDSLDKSSESTWKNMKTKIANAMDELNDKTQKALKE